MARILIIEDTADFRVAYQAMLEGEGYEVLEPVNGIHFRRRVSRLRDASQIGEPVQGFSGIG